MNDKPITTSPQAGAIEPLKPMIEDEPPCVIQDCTFIIDQRFAVPLAEAGTKPPIIENCVVDVSAKLSAQYAENLQKAFNKGYELGKRETARVMGKI